MDVVLGVALGSSAPATIHTVLVCGANGDGLILEEHTIDVPTDSDSGDFAAVDAAIAAILQAREAADTAGHHLVSTGLTVTDPIAPDAVVSRLAAGGLENITVISPSLAAASLAVKMGRSIHCDRMGLLSVESTDATLAVVDCGDGSVTRIFRRPLHDGDATAALDTVAGLLNTPETCPDGLLLVCSGTDEATIRPRLEASVRHVVSAPRDPRAALAHGAALATAQLLAAAEASTAALAYTQEGDSGAIAPGYYDIPDYSPGGESDELAYSAVPDEQAEAATELFYPVPQPTRRPLLVAGAVLASTAFAAASALMVSLALDITPNLVALRPDIGRVLSLPLAQPNLQVPATQPQWDTLPLPPVSLPAVSSPSAPDLPAPAPLALPAAPDLQMPPPLPITPVAAPMPAPTPVFGPPLPTLLPVLRAQPVHRSTPPASPQVLPGLPDLSFLLGLPAKKPAPPSSAPKPPPEVLTPPVVKPDPPDVKPDVPVTKPDVPVVKPDVPVVKPDVPVVKPDVPVVKPDVPVVKPDVPVIKPDVPVVKPDVPVVKPDLPVVKPAVPIVKPDVPVVKPAVPVVKPDVPVVKPDVPVIKLPDPPAQVPDLPAVNPSPPVVKLPELPAKVPDVPAVSPSPGIQLPNLPIQLPKSGPPASLPQAPALPSLTAPQAPALPAFPAPQAPSMPSLPAPSAPSLPSLGGNPGGGLFGGGGKPGGGLFGGGGSPGGGLFGGGGKPGGGLFGGGGSGGGLFGGSSGGGLFGGGGGGGLFGGGGGLFGK